MELERTFRVKLVSKDGSTVYNIPNQAGTMGIVENSINLNELICDGSFEIGNLLSNKLEIQLYGIRQDLTGYWITLTNTYAYDHSEGREAIEPWFKGVVKSSKTDNFNMDRKIIAYDYSYYVRNLDVLEWWTDLWAAQTSSRGLSLKTIREGLCTIAGFTLYSQQVALPNDSAVFGNTYQVPTVTSLKFGELLRMICELQACCPNINRSGDLEFIPMSDLTVADATNISDLWARNDTEFEDYTLDNIQRIAVLDDSSNVIQYVPIVSGTNVLTYEVKGNIFLLAQAARDIATLMTPVRNYLGNIQYSPTELHMVVSDYNYKLGTYLQIDNSRCDDNRCITTYQYVLNQTYSGPQLVDQVMDNISTGSKLKYTDFVFTPPQSL